VINREEGLTEIYERIKARRIILGLQAFKRTPTAPVREEMLPCIFMSEDVDNVIEHSQRNKTGYPARRVLEVALEIIASRDTDVKQLYFNVRRAVFMNREAVWEENDPSSYSPFIAENTFVNENRTEGPTGYGLPDVIGMRLVLDLVYTDNGFY
jgi:hypothetical protein